MLKYFQLRKNMNDKSKELDKTKDELDKIKDEFDNLLKIENKKGNIDLPILLSKLNINDSSKELINNIKQLMNDLYDNKQITKQVYNNLIKAVTYVQSTNANVYNIYK